jgi:hypothetical protein
VPLRSGRIGKKKRSRFGSGLKVVMGRLKAQRLGLGSRGQLGLRLSRPARFLGLAGSSSGWLCSWAGLASFISRTGSASSPSVPRSPAASAPFHADRAVPRGGLGGIRCGGPGSGAAGGRACVRVGAVARVRVWTLEGCSRKGLNGLAATRTRRRGHVAGVVAHGEAVARAWRG